jgi:homoserine kinase
METVQLVFETLGFALLVKASEDTAEEVLKQMMQDNLRLIRRAHGWTRYGVAKVGTL